MESQKSKTSKLKKNRCKINGEKKECQKVKKMELVMCMFFAFILLSRFAFILLFLLFARKKTKKAKKKKQKKANLESNINAKKCK